MNKVYQLSDGWFCLVGGEEYGPWICREYAEAGMQVEQRRAKSRYERAAREFMATDPDWYFAQI